MQAKLETSGKASQRNTQNGGGRSFTQKKGAEILTPFNSQERSWCQIKKIGHLVITYDPYRDPSGSHYGRHRSRNLYTGRVLITKKNQPPRVRVERLVLR
jgi:hypothetical protein